MPLAVVTVHKVGAVAADVHVFEIDTEVLHLYPESLADRTVELTPWSDLSLCRVYVTVPEFSIIAHFQALITLFCADSLPQFRSAAQTDIIIYYSASKELNLNLCRGHSMSFRCVPHLSLQSAFHSFSPHGFQTLTSFTLFPSLDT